MGRYVCRSDVFRVAHNVLLCVGKAEKAMRKAAKHKLNLGVSPCFTPMISTDCCGKTLAEKYNFTPNGEVYDGCFFTDALIKGEFSDEYKQWFAVYGYNPSQDDLHTIKCDFDFFGVNYYQGFYVEENENSIRKLPLSSTDKVTAMGWKVTPEGIEYIVKYYYDRYGLPIIFAENGVAITEWKTLDGEVPD